MSGWRPAGDDHSERAERYRAKARECRRRYAETHKEQMIQQRRAYQEAHPERVSASCAAYRETHREARRESDRASKARRREQIVAEQRALRQTPDGRAKALARKWVANAVASGRLVRQPCLVCGADNAQAHHHRGYEAAAALDVLWLCPLHHMQAHSKSRVAA